MTKNNNKIYLTILQQKMLILSFYLLAQLTKINKYKTTRKMNKTNRSNFTSLSFTVQDDLISQASVSTYIAQRKFPQNPFSQKYQLRGSPNNDLLENDNKPVKFNQKIKLQALNDAYKQLNNQMYNPFQHKLQNGFIPQQENLYQKQKIRQIQYLKKKHEQQLNNNRNYTILFNNNANKNNKNSIQLAASNILNEQNFSIQDYYNKNIKPKRQMNQIAEDDEVQSQQENENSNKNRIKNNLKQNNKINVAFSHKQIPKKLINSKNMVPSSTKQILSQQRKNNTSIQRQKPKTSKQVKKTSININNFVSAENKQKPNYSNNCLKKNQPLIPNKKANQIKNTKKQKAVKTNMINQKKKFFQVYQGPDRNLVEQIQNQVAQKTNIKFQDIAELQNAKSLLQQAVLLPKIMPQFFKGIRKAMKGILMFGPPGTGKTLLAKAVANDNMFFNVSASSLASKWKGESQKMVRILFQMARYYSPSVIFFDEIDAIASKRCQNQHQSSRKVKTELLVQMDGVQSSDQQVFVLAATNRPWDLDQALRRRLQKRIYIPLPQKLGRKKLFQINLKQIKLSQKVNWQRLIKQTQGYSGADISNVCRDGAYMPMRRMIAKVGIKKMAQINQKQLLEQQLSQKDLVQAIKNNKPSVNLDDLKKYDKWMKEFGSQ